MQKINVADIIEESIVDGPGVRFVVFTQGCVHKCNGCHNPKTHSFDVKNLIENDEIFNKLKANSLITGITVSGGEPFCQTQAVYDLIFKVKTQTTLDVVVYTGYTFEELLKMDDSYVEKILALTDILIDGKFVLEQRDLGRAFCGSTNQRIIDVQKSLRKNLVVLYDLNGKTEYNFE